jgi:hypothetical protein
MNEEVETYDVPGIAIMWLLALIMGLLVGYSTRGCL